MEEVVEIESVDMVLSRALVRVIVDIYEKLPEMLGIESHMPPELIVDRLVEFLVESDQLIMGEVMVSLILRRALKIAGPVGEDRIQRLLEGLYL